MCVTAAAGARLDRIAARPIAAARARDVGLVERCACALRRSVEVELVTPTGAALLTSLADHYGGFPAMTLKSIGVGAGQRDLPFPNVVRVLIGEDSG